MIKLTQQQKDFIDAIHIINETKLSMADIPLPLYVMAGHTAMRFITEDNQYYRDSGDWSIDYDLIDEKVYAKTDEIPELNGIELVEISFDEYYKDNYGDYAL